MKSKLVKVVRAIVYRAMIVLITLIMLLIIAEIATRTFSKIQPPLKIRDLEIGQKYIPNFSKDIFISESDQYVNLRFHRDGFRGMTREYRKAQRTCRIAILGDSQIAALATKEKETLVNQLEKILNERHPAIRWQVLNFGISGASTSQEFVIYRKLAAKYDPDIVMCTYNIGNDFSDNCSRLDTNPRIYMDINENGHLYIKPYSVTRKKLSIWLNQHSRFYVWQKYKIEVFIKTLKQSKSFYRIREGRLIFMNKDAEELNYAWSLNEKIIHAFHEDVVRDQRHFLFVVLPSSLQLYKDNWEEVFAKDQEAQLYLDVDYPDRRLAEIVDRKKIDALFLRAGLEEYINNRPHNDPSAQVLYGGKAHLNETGNLLSAKIIYAHLRDTGTISQMTDKYSKTM